MISYRQNRGVGSLNSFSEASLLIGGSATRSTKRSTSLRRTVSQWKPNGFALPRLTPIKLTLGAVAIATLLLTFAIQRLPGAERIEVPKPTIKEAQFDAAWADNFQQAVVKKQQDRVRVIELASTESKPVVTERIVPPTDAPAVMPPVVMVQEDKPASHGRRHYAENESNVCTRHHLRKIVTRSGKSWKCGR